MLESKTGRPADRHTGTGTGSGTESGNWPLPVTATEPEPVPVCPCARLPDEGFTLLEILVAIGLLAFLSIGIYQATTSSWDTNQKLTKESGDTTAIILSLQAVQNDLESIYTPRLGPTPATGVNPTDQVQMFWSAPVRTDGLRRSRFQGSAEKVSFVASNNRRVEADSPMCDLQKITWEIERNSSGTYSLYRITDWDVFHYEEDRSKKPERVALLENLSSAKFQFYRLADKTWQDTWDSESPYAKEEQRFPNLIKLKIEAPDPTNNANQLAWEIVVKPRMDLNYLDSTQRQLLKQRMD